MSSPHGTLYGVSSDTQGFLIHAEALKVPISVAHPNGEER